MSADIHASYDNLSTTQQRHGQTHEVAPSGGSQRSGTAHRESFYETSEHGSQWRQEAGLYTSRWEGQSAEYDHHSERQGSTARSSRAGGGSERAGGGSERVDRRAQSERSGRAGAAGGTGRSGSRGSLGGSESAESVEERLSSRRHSLSPRPAASARLSPADDMPGTLQRVLQPTDAVDAAAAVDGHETDGFTTRFVRQDTAGSRRAASATTLYMAPAVTGPTAGRGGPAGAGAGAGYGQRDRGVDEVGYPRRASGDWRRRSSTAELIVEDEVCDFEEREEVYSGAVKERISRHRGDAESSLEKGARRTRDEQKVRWWDAWLQEFDGLQALQRSYDDALCCIFISGKTT